MKLKIIDFRIWFLWVAIHGVSVILSYLLFLILRQVLCADIICYSRSTQASYISLLSFGIILGALEWFVIRRVFDTSIWWVVATGLGTILALFPFVIFYLFIANIGGGRQPRDSELKAAAIAGSFMGLIIGSAQWLILRKIVRNSKLWIFLNIIGYSLGLTAMGWESPQLSSFTEWLLPILSRDEQTIFFTAIAMLVPAVLTGFFLSWLSQKPSPTSPSDNQSANQ